MEAVKELLILEAIDGSLKVRNLRRKIKKKFNIIKKNEEVMEYLVDILISQLDEYESDNLLSKLNIINKIIDIIINDFNQINDIETFNHKIKLFELQISKINQNYIEGESNLSKFKELEIIKQKLLKLNCKIICEMNNGSGFSRYNDYSKFLNYIIFEMKDFSYIKIIIEKNPTLLSFASIFEQLMKKCLDNYLKSIDDNNYDDMIYYEKTICLMSKSHKRNVNDEIINRLHQYLSTFKSNNVSDCNKILSSFKNILNNFENKKQTKNMEFRQSLNYSIGNPQQSKIIFEDMTDRSVITMDSEGTMCRDDGISFEILSNGNYRMGIYITDIADYIIKSDKINYVLCQNQMMPAINEVLCILLNTSNICLSEICSLNSGSNKYVLAFTFEFTKNFEMCNFDIRRALIRVRKNYYYDKSDSILQNKNSIDEYQYIKRIVDFSEFFKDKYKYVENYHKEKNKNRINNNSITSITVSYIIIFLNNFLAEYFNEKIRFPFLYKNKITGYETDEMHLLKSKFRSSSNLSQIITSVQKAFNEPFYSPINHGHNGLKLSAYSRCTSPLLDYPSLVNQKIIIDSLIEERFDLKEMWDSFLGDIAIQLNNNKPVNKGQKNNSKVKQIQK